MSGILDCAKIFIPDTSVLMHDPNALENLAKDPTNGIVLPLCTLEEIDQHKHEQQERGLNSRAVVRWLDNLREKESKSLEESRRPLKVGVQIGEGRGWILIDHNGKSVKDLSSDLLDINDNKILVIAKNWQTKMENRAKVIVITKDINMRVKADALGILAQDYKQDKSIDHVSELYSGYTEINVIDSEMGVINDLPRNGNVSANDLSGSIDLESLFPNQCCKINFGNKYLLAIFKKRAGMFRYVQKPQRNLEEKIKIEPINDEQAMAFSLLMDPSVHFVTLRGKAGTGKSLISFLAGLQQAGLKSKGSTNIKKTYDALMIFKPIVEVGQRSLGYLPGDYQEKLEPWKQAIYDNLRLLLRDNISSDSEEKKISIQDVVNQYMEHGFLDIGTISYMRGRNLNNSFIVVDEAQNLTPHETKTLITRAATGSKVVLVGDTDQIDTPYLDPVSNGLSTTIQKLRAREITGHITLTQGERSELAELAADLL